MRNIALYLSLFAAAAFVAPGARAGMPLPSLTFYGMFLDEFGWPYPADDVVEIYADNVKILSQALRSAVGKDYNFIARVPYDSGGKLGDYSPDVISPGDNVAITLRDTGTGLIMLSTNFVCNLPAGAVVNFNSRSGTDSIGDGLPDELRQWIWSALGDGSPFDPSKVSASDDSDGDGVSNLNEFLAGTDPANAEDVLKVVITKPDNSDVAQLTFFSVPGKPYQVQTGQLSGGSLVWTTAPFASSPEFTPGLTEAIGTGHLLSVFVTASDEVTLFRLVVNPRPRGAVLLP